MLADVYRRLLELGISNIRFLIIGQGAEEQWLRENLPAADLPGVLRGVDLSRAYANMDLFVFPSHTDTFGNVVLEALASGVPAIVTPDGGPRYIVREGETGFVAEDRDFAAAAARVLSDGALRERMRRAARTYALTASWDAVFESVYQAYAGGARRNSAERERRTGGWLIRLRPALCKPEAIAPRQCKRRRAPAVQHRAKQGRRCPASS